VREWAETLVGGDNRHVRGGSFRDPAAVLTRTASNFLGFSTEDSETGFRVAASLTCPGAVDPDHPACP
jgi:hypothetical protein